MFAPVRTVAPANASSSLLAAVKTQLRVSGSGDDTLLSSLIDAYVAHLDGYRGILGRALVTQTWRQDFAAFCDRLSLPLAPAQSISAISYVDADGVSQTLSTDVYELLTDALGPYAARKVGQSWPGVGDANIAVSVTFVAGYGTAAQLPDDLKQAITLATGKLYSFARADAALSRETVAGIGTQEWAQGGMLADIDKMVDYILRNFRRVGF